VFRHNGTRADFLRRFLDLYYPLHFFAVFRAHELYNVEPFIELLRDPVLDLGCGDGEISHLLFGRCLEYGIDRDERVVRKTREKGYYKTVFTGDAHEIPLQDGSLGGIFSNCVLEHIPDMPGLLAEVSRVLRPGACFVATCLSPHYFDLNPVFRRFDTPMLRPLRARMIAQENRLHHHVSLFGAKEYARMFERNGMKLEVHRYYSTRPVSEFCLKWNTAVKYVVPFPVLLSHAGVLFLYLHLRYRVFSAKETVIGNWHERYSGICYERNECNETGAGQILVGRKTG